MSMGSHQSTAMKSDTWLTPPELLAKLGPFDLDPCCPPNMPWPTAARMLTPADDGLVQPWAGRCWVNPPYSREAVHWLRKLADHGHGTALTFARTETEWFVETIWRRATGALFLFGRLHFHYPDGRRAFANAGAPSVLVAYGWNDTEVLASCGISGHFVPLRLPRSVVALAVPASWRDEMLAWLRGHRGPVVLADLYRAFARHPKAARNPNYRAKIRQVLQQGPFRRVARGQWECAA